MLSDISTELANENYLLISIKLAKKAFIYIMEIRFFPYM